TIDDLHAGNAVLAPGDHTSTIAPGGFRDGRRRAQGPLSWDSGSAAGSRESEAPFGDDGTLHLAGAPVDGGDRRVPEQVLDPPVDRGPVLAPLDHTLGAQHV